MSLSRKIATKIVSGEVSLEQVLNVLYKYKLESLIYSIYKSSIHIASHNKKDECIMIEAPFELSLSSLAKIKRIVGNDLAPHSVSINKNVLSGFKARFRGRLYDGSAERIIKQLIKNS